MNNSTEDLNTFTTNIDSWGLSEIAHFIHLSDIESYEAVGRVIDKIAKASEIALEALRNGGRVIYIGAGTSGRIAAQDVVELKPTYGLGEESFTYIMAGGEKALMHSVEGSEDIEAEAVRSLDKIHLTKKDLVVGITASGTTPFVLSSLNYARSTGCHTIGITCNQDKPITKLSDLCIELLTGPEVIQGSTRMKAGTAQKMTLNIFSTAIAIKLGRTYRNTMSNMGSWYNQKLKRRAINILCEQFELSEREAKRILSSVDYNISKAIDIVKSKTKQR